MSDKLIKDGLRTSPKIGAVTVFAELLFVRLLIATCPLGRCPWNPDWILTHALPNRPRTRPTAIAEALQALLTAQLVARYHAPDGTAYLIIPNHGQRFKHAVRSPWPEPPGGPPDVEGQTFMALPGSPPDREIGKEPKARVSESAPHFTSLLSSSERKGRRGEGKPAPADLDQRLAADCLPEIIARYPRHDVPAQLRAATRYVRKERSDEQAEVSAGWFVAFWMKNAPEKKRPAPAPASSGPAAPAPLDPHAAEREMAAQRARYAAQPEPEPGTLDHALWLEARKSA